jgi:citrate synthase
MSQIERAAARTVGHIMSTPVMTATEKETVKDVAERMRAAEVGSVVVVDGDRVVGILTERDLVRFAATGADPSSELVGDWMVGKPETVQSKTELDAALHQLAERRYRHIPVVDDERLVGLVSMRDVMRIAEVRAFGTPAADVPRGLKGVVVAETEIGDVRGTEGFYHYRQYDAIELGRSCSLEEVWYLLYEGKLPDSAELAKFIAKVREARDLPAKVREFLPSIMQAGPRFVPLEALRGALSFLSSYWGFKSWIDTGRDTLKQQALQVCAVIPTLVTALYRLNRGEWPVDPHPELGYAANYLYMMSGTQPSELNARAIERYLIATIDHGFNASTFTARVVTSTGADLGAAVVAALGALSGPLHGGAPSRALDMLDEISTREQADQWIREAIMRGDKIMGFGHPVYKTDDPRSNMLRELAEELKAPKVEFAKYIETRVIELLEELKPGRKLRTNVEFYAAIVMESIGLPPELFTPTFACSRAIGWTAHILEQASDNRIIRPSGRYTGPPPPQPIPERA